MQLKLFLDCFYLQFNLTQKYWILNFILYRNNVKMRLVLYFRNRIRNNLTLKWDLKPTCFINFCNIWCKSRGQGTPIVPITIWDALNALWRETYLRWNDWCIRCLQGLNFIMNFVLEIKYYSVEFRHTNTQCFETLEENCERRVFY